MTDFEWLVKVVQVQTSVKEKSDKEKEAAKAGRIYKTGSDIYVVTFNDGFNICVIHNDGFTEAACLKDFDLDELIAEYPTWQEAVNSKEFKE